MAAYILTASLKVNMMEPVGITAAHQKVQNNHFLISSCLKAWEAILKMRGTAEITEQQKPLNGL